MYKYSDVHRRTVANMEASRSVAASSRVPVIIVTGYVASGKFTLVERLLEVCQSEGIRAGVIVHCQAEEFGITTNHLIDARASYHNTVYDFGSGCICCSPKGDLIRQLADLRNQAEPVELLILRLGALASPLVFAKAICQGIEAPFFELASIITMINEAHAPRHLAAGSAE